MIYKGMEIPTCDCGTFVEFLVWVEFEDKHKSYKAICNDCNPMSAGTELIKGYGEEKSGEHMANICWGPIC